MRTNPVPVVKEIFKFLLDVESIEGTVVEKKIEQVCAEGTQAKAVYALKSKSSSLSRNNDNYTEA